MPMNLRIIRTVSWMPEKNGVTEAVRMMRGRISLNTERKDFQPQVMKPAATTGASRSPYRMAEMGQKKAAAYFKNDHTHTSLKGAQLNAQSVAKGLRDLNSPVAFLLRK